MTRFRDECLIMQGFGFLSFDQREAYAPYLRFTPAACTSLVLLGLAFGSAWILAVTAGVALAGSVLPVHPLDAFYNRVLRRLVRSPELPPTPAPRRFAAAIKSAPLFVAAAALGAGNAPLAYAIGGFLVAIGTIAAVSHWDLGSWLYRVGIEGHAPRLIPVRRPR